MNVERFVASSGLGCALLCALLGGCDDGGESVDSGRLDANVPRDSGPATLCARDLECSNTVFCDGEERCVPGAMGATPEGCVAGDPPCTTGERCEEATETCTPDDCVDVDEDGFDTCSGDCDDTRADINPSTEELCVPDDPTDEDCNPRTYGFVDIDMDGAADARCFNEDMAGTRFGGTDCDDNNAAVSPLAAEVCDGVRDENCDGVVDEDCLCSPEGSTRSCGSGLGECAGAVETCAASGWSTCSRAAGAELCDGSRDEDCDGSVDEGCSCVAGTTQVCGRGACLGLQRCVAGSFDSCDGAAPTTETCDGEDTDCDGIGDASDPDVVGVGDTCGTNQGLCVAGTQSCMASELTCGGPGHIASVVPEICNHQDESCDGVVDDGASIPAQCNRIFGSFSREPAPPPLGSSRDLSDRSAGDQAPRIAFASGWAGDFGRANYYRARVRVSDTAPTDSALSNGAVTLVFSPVTRMGLSSSCGTFCSGEGLPVLLGDQRAIAVQVLSGSAVLLLRGDSRGWHQVRTGVLDFGCRDPGTGMDYTLELIHTAGSFTARVSGSGCARVDLTWESDSDWLAYYGEGTPYPMYSLGVLGNADGQMYIRLEELYMQRRVRSGGRNDCVGCF